MKPAWLLLTTLMLVLGNMAQAETPWPKITRSADGVAISYQVHGAGAPTLVLVHGWSCDARYWREQVDAFATDHQVVVIDLAGHGHSGMDRKHFSMDAFGQDVAAVVESVAAEQVILVGHSMGGAVSVAAAQHLADRLIGIIGVDTFHGIDQVPDDELIQSWLGPLETDFRVGTEAFVAQMFIESTDGGLRDWVIDDMAAAPPAVAISAMSQMLADLQNGQASRAFAELDVPVIAINADIWPTDTDGNQQLLDNFQAVILPDTDHFLHMAHPDIFNNALATVIRELTESAGQDQP